MRRFFLAIACCLLAPLPATAAEPIDAVWSGQKVDFTFIAIETAYSCELLEGRIEMLLRQVGAKDVHATVPSCNAFTYPRRQLRVMAGFSTLVPAGDGDADTVQAEWSEVVLDKRHPRSLDDRDCELLEQFQEYVLPAIKHEVVDGTLGCGATRRSIQGRLKIRILEPIAADDPPEPGN